MTSLNNIKQLRWEQNLTLRQLSKLSGVDYSTISKIENHLVSPTQINILLISKGFRLKTALVFNMDWEHCDL
jgi:transcriptional regulator with XRE-family HTH domain